MHTCLLCLMSNQIKGILGRDQRYQIFLKVVTEDLKVSKRDSQDPRSLFHSLELGEGLPTPARRLEDSLWRD